MNFPVRFFSENKSQLLYWIISVLVIGTIAYFGINTKRYTGVLGAGDINVTDRASVINTNGYLNFTANAANVKVNNISHKFSGYAWSDDLGWVAFGDEDNPNGAVVFDAYSGKVTGKARVMYDGTDIVFDAAPNGSNVQISSAGVFSGYAWSPAIGWLNFSGVNAAGISLVPPDAPQNVRIYDTSDRTLADYSLTVRWQAPIFFPGAFDYYIVEKGTDGVTFAQVATTTSLGYLDTTVVTGTTYYYQIKSHYIPGTTATSAIVSLNPTGKYTSPPLLIGTPSLDIKVASVDFAWVTDRAASSYVRITQGNTFVSEQGHSTFEQTHNVQVTGLKPDITYNYQIRWVDSDGNIGQTEISTLTTAGAPYIGSVAISDIRLDSALIIWQSSSVATTRLYYGKDTNYGQIVNDESGGGTTNHAVHLTGLETGTIYHFKIRGTDIDDNDLISDDYSFSTLPLPQASSLRVEQVKDAASTTYKATWKTNVKTSSVLTYTRGGGETKSQASTDLVTDHEMIISDLADQSTYIVTVSGRDEFGNEVVPVSQTITTPQDTRAPKISDITIETGNIGIGKTEKSQVSVSWKTDEPATSQVEYAQGITGEYTQKTQEDATLTDTHLIIIPGLDQSTPYHLKVDSKDGAGNLTTSGDNTFVSGKVQKSILTIILETFQNIFGWMGRFTK